MGAMFAKRAIDPQGEVRTWQMQTARRRGDRVVALIRAQRRPLNS